MNGQQTITAGIGTALIVGNFWKKQRGDITNGIFNSSAKPGQTQTAHSTLVKVGAEVIAVAVATLLAGMSGSAGNAIVAIMVALAILWIVNRNK